MLTAWLAALAPKNYVNADEWLAVNYHIATQHLVQLYRP
jgi:hypothetical protein